MRITIAIDSLKGSLSSEEAGLAACEGINRVYHDAQVHVYPVADGGEGTLEALICAMKGRKKQVRVCGPLGKPVMAEYGIIEHRRVAVIEMAAAAGLTLLQPHERNPLKTTTYGVGQMILDAVRSGCRSFLIGIGGSCTNDGGVGMLQALGYEFIDNNGKSIEPGAKGLENLRTISVEHVAAGLSECVFHIACDVKNPLCGKNGCSAVFSPQKGASGEDIHRMDAWLSHYADLTEEMCPSADRNAPGAGAAGGLGFAFLAYMNAHMEPGIDMVLREIGIEEKISKSDLVITGEGMLDGQSVMGKTPTGIAKLAKKYDKPVIAFAGAVKQDAYLCNGAGIDAFFPILRDVVSLEEAMDKEHAAENMTDTVEQVFRLIRALKHIS